jgi:hypothetical protein
VSGFRARLPDLQALTQGCNPAVVCLQETHLRPWHGLLLRCYDTLHYDHPDGERCSGWTAVVVRYCICYLSVSFRSPLQVIAVHVHLPNFRFTLCDVCLPPATDVRLADLANSLSQLFSATLVPSIFFGVQPSPTTGEHHLTALQRISV